MACCTKMFDFFTTKLIDFVDPGLKKFSRKLLVTFFVAVLSFTGMGFLLANNLRALCGTKSYLTNAAIGEKFVSNLPTLGCIESIGILKADNLTGFMFAENCPLPSNVSVEWCATSSPTKAGKICPFGDATFQLEFQYYSCPITTAFGTVLGYRSIIFPVASFVVAFILQKINLIEEVDGNYGLPNEMIEQLSKLMPGLKGNTYGAAAVDEI